MGRLEELPLVARRQHPPLMIRAAIDAVLGTLRAAFFPAYHVVTAYGITVLCMFCCSKLFNQGTALKSTVEFSAIALPILQRLPEVSCKQLLGCFAFVSSRARGLNRFTLFVELLGFLLACSPEQPTVVCCIDSRSTALNTSVALPSPFEALSLLAERRCRGRQWGRCS